MTTRVGLAKARHQRLFAFELRRRGFVRMPCERSVTISPTIAFVLRTDVKSYQASIDHVTLLDQLAVHVKDRRGSTSSASMLRPTAPTARRRLSTWGKRAAGGSLTTVGLRPPSVSLPPAPFSS